MLKAPAHKQTPGYIAAVVGVPAATAALKAWNSVAASDWFRKLAARRGKHLSHTAGPVWGGDYTEQTECLRVFVGQLRKKLESDPANPNYILTEPWIGYRFNPGE